MAKFEHPWLKIGNDVKIGVDGRYEIGESSRGGIVSNLWQSCLEFVEKQIEIMDSVRVGLLKGAKGKGEPIVYIGSKYMVELTIPRKIVFWNRGVSGILKIERNEGGYTRLQTGNLVFEEFLGYDEKLEEKILNLALKYDIGYPAEMLSADVKKDTLILYAPDGKVVFEVDDKTYNLNFLTLCGYLDEKDVVFEWIGNVAEKLLKENVIKEYEKIGKDLFIKSESYEILYNVRDAELVKFSFLVRDLKVRLTEDKFWFWARGKIDVEVRVEWQDMVRFKREVGNKLWGFLRWLVF